MRFRWPNMWNHMLQEQGDVADVAGPLAEVAFWRSRTEDLAGIRDQLDDRRKQITKEPTEAFGILICSTSSKLLRPASLVAVTKIAAQARSLCILDHARSVQQNL